MEFSEHTYKMLAEGLRVFPDGEAYPEGRFVLEEMVGEGGMGVVWRALDRKLDQVVALKFVPDRLRTDGEALEQLKSEAIKGRRLTHQHIVAVYDFLQSKEHAAVSMEYAEGLPLSVMKARAEGHCFDVSEITNWVEQMCAALEYAHTRGGKAVVHRDLKPSNFLTSGQGELKVADFGIARTLADSFARLSNVGMGGGTLGYCSPQQLNGKPPRVADDVYSIGATIYDLLTGTAPFYTGDIPYQTRNVAAIPMAERRGDNEVEGKDPIPPGWEDVVARCLSKEPAGRPSSCGEILFLLELNKSYPTPAATVSTPPTLPPQMPPVPVVPATAATAQEVPTAMPEERETVVFAPEEEKKSALGLWIALVCLAVVGLGVGVAVALMSRPDDPVVVDDGGGNDPVVLDDAGGGGKSSTVPVLNEDAKEAMRLVGGAEARWANKDWKGALQYLKTYEDEGYGGDLDVKVAGLKTAINTYVEMSSGTVRVRTNRADAEFFVGNQRLTGSNLRVQGLGDHVLTVTAPRCVTQAIPFTLRQSGDVVELGTVNLPYTQGALAEMDRTRREEIAARNAQAARDAEARAAAERLAKMANAGVVPAGESMLQKHLGAGPDSKVYVGNVGPERAVWSVRWKANSTVDGAALIVNSDKEFRFTGTNFVDGKIEIRMTEYDGVTEKWVGNATLRKHIVGSKVGWLGTAPDGRQLYLFRNTGRASQERFVSSYAGKVGNTDVDVYLTWSSDHRVTGSYTSRSSGKRYVLKGDNIDEGVVYLDEYTDGSLSARVLLGKRKVGETLRWAGMMYNLDGRQVPVSFWKK